MNQLSNLIICLSLFFLLTACKKKTKYVIKESGGEIMVSEKTDIDFKIDKKDTVNYRKSIEAKERNKYFTLSLSGGDKEIQYAFAKNQDEYYEMVNRISFRLPVYIYALSCGDTIRLKDFSVSSLYGMSKATTCLLVFDKVKISKCGNYRLVIDELIPSIPKKEFEFSI